MNDARNEFREQIEELRSWISDLSNDVLNSGRSGIERDALSRAAITVLLAGRFEHHLKNLTKRFIAKINDLNAPFCELPKQLQKCHLEEGAKFLAETIRDDYSSSRQGDSYPATHANSNRVMSQLTSINGGHSYELVAEAFAKTDSNVRPKIVSKILRRLGTNEPWQQIASNASPLANSTPQAGGASNLGLLQSVLISQLNSLIEARNRCAHGVINEATPGLEELTEFLNTIDSISSGLLSTLNGRLADITQEVNPNSPTRSPPNPPPPDPPTTQSRQAQA